MVRALCPVWHVSDNDLCNVVVEWFSQDMSVPPPFLSHFSPCFLASCKLFAAYSPLPVLDAVNRGSRDEDAEKAGKERGRLIRLS